MKPLRERLTDVPHVGTVTWIGVRPEAGERMLELHQVEALEQRGLAGDRAARARGGKRQVTLIQAEHLPALASLLRIPEVSPQQLRRNLVVTGINLISLVRLYFRIGGDVVLLGTGPCQPCSKMDELLGSGGFQAMRGHRGITAQVVTGGTIRLGDLVKVDTAAR
jgi:MOSC domain-containing protein YiiM